VRSKGKGSLAGEGRTEGLGGTREEAMGTGEGLRGGEGTGCSGLPCTQLRSSPDFCRGGASSREGSRAKRDSDSRPLSWLGENSSKQLQLRSTVNDKRLKRQAPEKSWRSMVNVSPSRSRGPENAENKYRRCLKVP